MPLLPGSLPHLFSNQGELSSSSWVSQHHPHHQSTVTLPHNYNQPSNPWVTHPWLNQCISGGKKKMAESSKKQSLNLPHASNYLHSIYIVLGIISNVEMFYYLWEDAYKSYANTMPVYIRYLSILQFWNPQGSWNQSPVDTEGRCIQQWPWKTVCIYSFDAASQESFEVDDDNDDGSKNWFCEMLGAFYICC